LQGAKAEKAVPYLALRRPIPQMRPTWWGGLPKITTDCFCTGAIGLPPSAQLLGFCLFSTFEIIVRLQEEKPSTLPIADRTCLLQVLFRLVSQDIDAAHAAIPVS
jgi:hypothetical protein